MTGTALDESLGRPARRRPASADERAATRGRHRGGRHRPRSGAARLAPSRRRDPPQRPRSTRTSIPAPGEPPVIGIVGAGAVGTALGVALTRAGWPIHAVASRDPGRRERFRSLVDVSRAFADPEPILDEVELIILAVPDDAVAAAGRRRSGCTAARR